MSIAQNNSRRRVLFVAYHFPPLTGSSGLLRSMKFCRYLPENGWEPVVLTAHPRAYPESNGLQMPPGLEDLRVIRAFALDTRRHLSIKGRYLRRTALPDRWVSWVLGAIPAGLRALRREKIDVIFSTYPIATAILIGYLLHRLSGKPWVVDLRDPLVEYNYPSDPAVMAAHRWIESKVIAHASLIVFTARSSLRMYQSRYPNLSEERCLLLPNGYDEEDFESLTSAQLTQAASGPLRLVHAGTIYPDARDPSYLFAALARLKREGRMDASQLLIDLRAPGFEDQYSAQLRKFNIEDMVRVLPALPYRESLADAAAADGLLLLQGPSCDRQIPAKAYEYLRTGKPILALTSETGDTADLLHKTGGAQITDITNEDGIYSGLPGFIHAIKNGGIEAANPQKVRQYARRELSAELGRALARVAK